MYTAEQIFQTLTYEDLYYTLRSIADEDSYFQEFLENQTLEDFLYLLELYDIVFIASDERILLSQKGEKVLQYISQLVDLNKN
jgi:hypothetical protein